jgi:hypothetical protein
VVERADRLGVVERVREAEPLVEVLLGERLGRRHRVMVGAEIGVERNRGLLVRGFAAALGAGGERERAERRERDSTD